MSTNFTTKFATSILSVLGCHDRVIFKGYLPFGGESHLNNWVDRVLNLRRKDFLPFVEKQSQILVDHAKTQANQAGVSFQVLKGKPNKDALVRNLLGQSPRDEGLITVLQVMETCRTVKLMHGQGRPRLAFARRPQVKEARSRLARLQGEAETATKRESEEAELTAAISQLEGFASRVRSGLEAANWKARREILRALVKRVEVGTDAVKVVYKVDPRPFDQGPERGSSQDCGRSDDTSLG